MAQMSPTTSQRPGFVAGAFFFATLNVALNNTRHAANRPSVSGRDDPKRPIKRYRSKGVGYVPHNRRINIWKLLSWW